MTTFNTVGIAQDTTETEAVFVRVETIEVYQPNDPGFSNVLEWPEVLFRDQPVRAKITLSSAIPSFEVFHDKVEIRIFSEETASTWHTIPLNENAELVSNEIRVTLTWEELITLGMIPENPNDSIDNEFTSVDYVRDSESNWNDANAFDSGMENQGHTRRGKARKSLPESFNGDESTLVSAVNEEFLRAAGVMFVQFRAPGNGGYIESERRQIQNQADYLYYSGHGSHNGKYSTCK